MKIRFEDLPFKMPNSIKAALDAQDVFTMLLATFEVEGSNEIQVSFTGISWNIKQPRKSWFHEPRQSKYVSAEIYSELFRKGFNVKLVSSIPNEKLHSALKAFMVQADIGEFVRLLEANGYSGSMALIMNELLPIARKHHISLLAATKRYANCDEEQDTSFFQLGKALFKIGNDKLSQLDIHQPL
jgi:hypothetical protein